MKRCLTLLFIFFTACAHWYTSIDLVAEDLESAVVNQEYFHQFEIISDTDESYVVSVKDGQIPGGMILEDDGLLWGTPMQAGEFRFEVSVVQHFRYSGSLGEDDLGKDDAENTDSEWFVLIVEE